jgi:hypothetical protein
MERKRKKRTFFFISRKSNLQCKTRVTPQLKNNDACFVALCAKKNSRVFLFEFLN